MSESGEEVLRNRGRRVFLAAAGMAVGGVVLWGVRGASVAAAGLGEPVAGGAGAPGMVSIVEFTSDGKAAGTKSVPRVVKTDAQWREQLPAISYEVTRRAGTERPYSGATWNEHRRGLFRCICCDVALFSSETKFDSGTGWPSFWQPIAKENVVETGDASFGMMRTAVSCRECEAHLGHVFDDGPRPTGLRYCMNSAAMRFVALG